MRNCKKCNEELEDNFEICWKCGEENELTTMNYSLDNTKLNNDYIPDELSFGFPPMNNNSNQRTNIIDNKTSKKSNKLYFFIIIFLFGLIMVSSVLALQSKLNFGGKETQNSITNTPSYNTNMNRGDHISYVRNNFQSSGKDVYQINIIGTNGENGYVIYVNGYDRQRGFSFDCNVKTDGTNGIVITDPGCNVNTQY